MLMLFNEASLPAYEYPQEFQDIIDIVGEDLAYEYAYEMGGVDIYIIRWSEERAKRNEDLNDMIDYFGIEKTRAIVARLGSGMYSIPNCKSKRIKAMHGKVIKMCLSGLRHKDIARKHKITTRTVRNIVHKARAQAMMNQGVLV